MDFTQIAKQLMNNINLPRENEEEYQKDIEAALSRCYIQGLNDGRAGDPQGNRPWSAGGQ